MKTISKRLEDLEQVVKPEGEKVYLVAWQHRDNPDLFEFGLPGCDPAERRQMTRAEIDELIEREYPESANVMLITVCYDRKPIPNFR